MPKFVEYHFHFSKLAQCIWWNYTFNTAQLSQTTCTVRFFAQCAFYGHVKSPSKWLRFWLGFTSKLVHRVTLDFACFSAYCQPLFSLDYSHLYAKLQQPTSETTFCFVLCGSASHLAAWGHFYSTYCACECFFGHSRHQKSLISGSPVVDYVFWYYP